MPLCDKIGATGRDFSVDRVRRAHNTQFTRSTRVSFPLSSSAALFTSKINYFELTLKPRIEP